MQLETKSVTNFFQGLKMCEGHYEESRLRFEHDPQVIEARAKAQNNGIVKEPLFAGLQIDFGRRKLYYSQAVLSQLAGTFILTFQENFVANRNLYYMLTTMWGEDGKTAINYKSNNPHSPRHFGRTDWTLEIAPQGQNSYEGEFAHAEGSKQVLFPLNREENFFQADRQIFHIGKPLANTLMYLVADCAHRVDRLIKSAFIAKVL